MRTTLLVLLLLLQGCVASGPRAPTEYEKFMAKLEADRAAEKKRIEEQLEKEQQARETYVRSNKKLSKKKKDAILAREIMIGMTQQEVELSWGKPMRINRSGGSGWNWNQWVYTNAYIYFKDGLLESWQTFE